MSENRRPVFGRVEARANPIGYNQYKKMTGGGKVAVAGKGTVKADEPNFNRKVLKGLAEPDSGFTISQKLVPLHTGFAVAIKGSDRLVLAKDAFDADGNVSPKLKGIVKERVTAAAAAAAPKGTKAALGGWHNPADGKIEINVTVVFPKSQQARATKFAKDNDQISMFALHSGKIIPTGGTGGERQTE